MPLIYGVAVEGGGGVGGGEIGLNSRHKGGKCNAFRNYTCCRESL